MPARKLSSALTPAIKFVIPVLGPGFIGWVGAAALLGGAAPPNGMSPLGMVMTLLTLSGLISAVLFYFAAPFKRVHLDGSTLKVSNYFEELDVPLSDVERITEFRWSSHHPITLHLAFRTRFGSKIKFFPQQKLGMMVGFEHPLVEELTHLVYVAKQRIRMSTFYSPNPTPDSVNR